MIIDGLTSLDSGENAVQIKRDMDVAVEEVVEAAAEEAEVAEAAAEAPEADEAK